MRNHALLEAESHEILPPNLGWLTAQWRLRNRPGAKPRFGFWRWLPVRRSRLPRLKLEDLSEHRLRDLGFIDGRAVQPRDPLRD